MCRDAASDDHDQVEDDPERKTALRAISPDPADLGDPDVPKPRTAQGKTDSQLENRVGLTTWSKVDLIPQARRPMAMHSPA